MLNRLFIEPLLGMGYPVNEIKTLRRIEKYIKQNDEQDLQKFDMDFIGIQNYTHEIIRYAMFVPFLQGKIVNAKDRNVEMTAMEWGSISGIHLSYSEEISGLRKYTAFNYY